MKLLLLFAPLLAATAAAPSPQGLLDKRQIATLCDQFASYSGLGYNVYNNLYGEDSATSGFQCTYVDTNLLVEVGWHTTWQWTGGTNIPKSYANSAAKITQGRTIGSIVTMLTTATWTYSTSSVQANVAYDLFTQSTGSGGDYEVMIWLATFGNAPPIGSSAGTVTVGGRSWMLYVGMDGSTQVYTFVATSDINTFVGDVKPFFSYLATNKGYPASTQKLTAFQFGTEAFTGGPATFSVSLFTAAVV